MGMAGVSDCDAVPPRNADWRVAADGSIQSVFPVVQSAWPRDLDARIPFLVYDDEAGAFYQTADFR